MNGLSRTKKQGLTVAQYRMLGRIINGQRLTIKNYLVVGTMAALVRKKFVTAGKFIWASTELGKKRYLAQRPTVEKMVDIDYDMAS